MSKVRREGNFIQQEWKTVTFISNRSLYVIGASAGLASYFFVI